MGRYLNAEVIAEIRRLSAEGLSSYKISDKTGVSRNTINKYLNPHRLDPIPPPPREKVIRILSPETRAEINELYRKGVSGRKIATLLKINRAVVAMNIECPMNQNDREELVKGINKSYLQTLEAFMEDTVPELNRDRAIEIIHLKMERTYTEAETYYNEWRKEYMKRRAL